MIARQRIQEVSDQIARKFRPDRIILFGSYAYGAPTEDSDVDLLVVMPHEGSSVAKAIEIESDLRVEFPMDLIVSTPGRLQERVRLGDFFLREVTEKGKILYESAHAGVG